MCTLSGSLARIPAPLAMLQSDGATTRTLLTTYTWRAPRVTITIRSPLVSTSSDQNGRV